MQSNLKPNQKLTTGEGVFYRKTLYRVYTQGETAKYTTMIIDHERKITVQTDQLEKSSPR